MTQSKYMDIPFGYFQNIIDTAARMESRLEVITAGKDITSTIGRVKSRLEASEVITYIDDQGRQIEVYYRVIDCCDNAQTDLSGDNYTIEQCLYKGRRVNLSGRGEQNILNWLNRENPSALKFQSK